MIVTAGQMKKIEQNAGVYGLSMERLMENAGSAAAAVIRRTLEVDGRFITIFCGQGNNGGDGFVVARRLTEAGAHVVVVLTDGKPRSEQAQEMFSRLNDLEIPVVDFEADLAYLTDRLAETDLLVDAIYGTGFHGELDERHRGICRLLDGVEAETVALDIPSGVSADTGAADDYAVRADYTIVFDSLKPAVVMPACAELCGQVLLVDIGIPQEARQEIEERYLLWDETAVRQSLPKRKRASHKGDYGKLLNIAGCQNYMGAAALSTLAAMRAGAGYVTLASTKEVCRAVLPMLPEAVLLPLRQTPEGGISYESMPALLQAAENSTAVLIGNGLGTGPDAWRIVYGLIEQVSCPVILDADGINAVSRNIDILHRARGPVVLTPHLKELSRLTTLPLAQLLRDPLPAGLAFAKEYQVTLALKGAYSLTVTPDERVLMNTTGNAGLAKAGSGDLLAGIIGSLAAQGRSPSEAVACAIYLHGLAGDYAAAEHSQYGMLSRDVIQALGKVFLDLAL